MPKTNLTLPVFSKLLQIWSVALILFWAFYDTLAFVITEDPLPVQGFILCTLGTLAATSLLLSTIHHRVGSLLTIAFSLMALMSMIYYNDDVFLILFLVIFLILPLLIPSLFLLLARVSSDAKSDNTHYFWVIIVMVGLGLIILSSTWFLGWG